MDVVLGPVSDLHPGAHGALLAAPPPGVRYRLAACRRAFTFAGPLREGGKEACPLDRFAIDEAVSFAGTEGADLAHLHHLPLVGAVPWIVETDDLPATLSVGRFYPFGSAGFRLADLDEELVRRRERSLFIRFCSRQCAALVFWTELARNWALRYARDRELASPRALDRLEAKSVVIHPTLVAPARRPKPDRLRVLYSGRSDDKGGRVALAAFGEIAELLGDDVELVYVGEPPADGPLHHAIRILPLKERSSYLAELDAAHIFVSPTEFESYGMALVEAAAYGLALVTTLGLGMNHVEELFTEGENALFLDTEWSIEKRVHAVRSHLLRLARDRALLAAISERNRALVEGGKLSITRRNLALVEAYERCATISRRRPSAGRPEVWLDDRSGRAALEQRVGRRYVRLRI